MMPCEITSSFAFVIKQTFTKCFRLFLHQNFTYVFHLWTSITCVCPFDCSPSTQHNTTHHQHTNATLEQDESKNCLADYLCGDFRIVNCVQKSPQYNTMPTTSGESKRACSERNRYEIQWHVVSLTRLGLNPKLHEGTDKLRSYGETLFIGNQRPLCRCRSGRGVKLTTHQPGKEIYIAQE